MSTANIWYILIERLEDVLHYLVLDPEMKVLCTIGKFHLADHVNSCFSKWTLNFMKGSGHIDGEIMETLRSGMNKVSRASMSRAHRQETLDEYMRDANWKKTVRIGNFSLYKIIQSSHICFFFSFFFQLQHYSLSLKEVKLDWN